MRRSLGVGVAALVALGLWLAASAGASPQQRSSAGFGWFKAAAAPAGWKRLSLPPKAATLSYPPSLARIRGDSYSVSVAKKDGSGRILVYLNATPKQGNETLANWPSFRIQHNRGESNAVRKEAQAVGLRFLGAKGSCVIDHYVTHVKDNHYREIACFVQGRKTASVIVAAALQSEWTRAVPVLERAVEAYRVG